MRKTNRTANKIFVIFVLLIMVTIAVLYLKNKQTTFTNYKNFGISIPDGFSIHGIDISHHEGKINWDLALKMKADDIKINFVFSKATQGVNYIDENYAYNSAILQQKNITQGCFHYLMANQSGIAQAQFFIKNANLSTGNLYPVLDVEELAGATPTQLQTCVKDWLQTIENYYNVKPIIYANADFYNTYLADVCKNYPLWVAHYTATNSPRVRRKYLLWQHTENATIAGINDLVDFNVFNGDSLAFTKIILP